MRVHDNNNLYGFTPPSSGATPDFAGSVTSSLAKEVFSSEGVIGQAIAPFIETGKMIVSTAQTGQQLAKNITNAQDQGQPDSQAYTCQTARTLVEAGTTAIGSSLIGSGFVPYAAVIAQYPLVGATVPFVAPAVATANEGVKALAKAAGDATEGACNQTFQNASDQSSASAPANPSDATSCTRDDSLSNLLNDVSGGNAANSSSMQNPLAAPVSADISQPVAYQPYADNACSTSLGDGTYIPYQNPVACTTADSSTSYIPYATDTGSIPADSSSSTSDTSGFSSSTTYQPYPTAASATTYQPSPTAVSSSSNPDSSATTYQPYSTAVSSSAAYQPARPAANQPLSASEGGGADTGMDSFAQTGFYNPTSVPFVPYSNTGLANTGVPYSNTGLANTSVPDTQPVGAPSFITPAVSIDNAPGTTSSQLFNSSGSSFVSPGVLPDTGMTPNYINYTAGTDSGSFVSPVVLPANDVPNPGTTYDPSQYDPSSVTAMLDEYDPGAVAEIEAYDPGAMAQIDEYDQSAMDGTGFTDPSAVDDSAAYDNSDF